ncbi:MAG: hypothetical protein JO115_17980 [Pseudonocardiales bacterium]|nr:hypothetical protein [Pseudonocardiales bacterium]
MKIEVMILGEEGSGKTLYLAGLHRAMGPAQVEIAATLRTDGARRVTLDNIYSKVIRPDDPKFPLSNPWGVQKWPFECVITGADNQEYFPFSVVYSDYAGEMLHTEKSLSEIESDPEMQEFFARQKSAHVFLILIDGHKMYRFLKDDPKARFWLDDYLPRVLKVIEKRKPVHLVVTKWGILASEGISLEKVRDILLEQETLKNFIAAQLQKSIIRLIPVDVVGPFARLNDEGVMVKIPEARVTPVNLLVPFVAVLPDIIQQKINESKVLANQTDNTDTKNSNQVIEQLLILAAKKSKEILKRSEDPLVRFVTSLLESTTGPSQSKPRSAATARKTVQGTLFFVERYIARKEEQREKKQEQLRREINERQLEIDNEQAALHLVIDSCNARLLEFERQYPASILHRTQP